MVLRGSPNLIGYSYFYDLAALAQYLTSVVLFGPSSIAVTPWSAKDVSLSVNGIHADQILLQGTNGDPHISLDEVTELPSANPSMTCLSRTRAWMMTFKASLDRADRSSVHSNDRNNASATSLLTPSS